MKNYLSASMACLLTFSLVSAREKIGQQKSELLKLREKAVLLMDKGEKPKLLQTDYKPLDRWLGDKFQVKFANMPLDLVFDQQPVSDVKFKFANLPKDQPLFDFDSPAISRRALLLKIAEFWNLKMKINYDEKGDATHILVSGRN